MLGPSASVGSTHTKRRVGEPIRSFCKSIASVEALRVLQFHLSL